MKPFFMAGQSSHRRNVCLKINMLYKGDYQYEQIIAG
jgi:hypothetical protein